MYASLPNYEEREEEFRAESVILRRRFTEDGAHEFHPYLAIASVVDERDCSSFHSAMCVQEYQRGSQSQVSCNRAMALNTFSIIF